MRPASIIGLVLIVVGGIIMWMGGFSFVSKKETQSIGPIDVSHTEKSTIPPVVGMIALGAGVVLVIAGLVQRQGRNG
jgi:hypothetical protein